jgi:hypothetical protein
MSNNRYASTPPTTSPIPSNYEHNLYITLINNHNTDNIDYNRHPMIVVPQYAVLGQHTTCLSSTLRAW